MAGYEGTVVLNYRLVRKLGEGGFGAVFLAEHTELGRKAACKILHREFADQAEVVERFFREARSVCAIGHRAIVQIENFGRLPDGEPFYLMEYLAGESLSARVKRRPLRVDEALLVFEPVASALAAAHAKQIIHRDLKPENIMVREERGVIVEVKLLDFGVAKLAQEADSVRSRSNVPMGTPAYMPPEQARDAKHVDERSDVYSFAATMYAAFAGRPPFVAAGVAGVILKVQLEEAAPLRELAPHVPGPLQAAIERCMDKEPERRPATIQAAWAAIRAACGDAAVTVAPDVPGWTDPRLAVTVPPATAAGLATTLGSSTGQHSSASTRRRGWIWIAGLVVVAATGVVAFASLGGFDRGADSAPAVAPTAMQQVPDAAVAVAPVEPPDAFVEAIDAAEQIVKADDKPVVKPPKRPKGVTGEPKTAPKPDPPKPDPPPDPPRPDPPALDCSVAGFARTYNAASPSDVEVNAALARLKKCQSQLNADKFKQIQAQLVRKL